MNSLLLKETSKIFLQNIVKSGIECGLRNDITSHDGSKIFLKAGTKITPAIEEKLQLLQLKGVIADENSEENYELSDTLESQEFISSIKDCIRNNPVLSKHQLSQTLQTLAQFIQTETIPEKILDHLTVFAKYNPKEFEKTLFNLVFGTHIGKANHYSKTELNELMSVLFFADIGYARLDLSLKNAHKVHPLLSREIVAVAGIENKLILESIAQHEEKLDGTGYPYKLTKIHEYAQISQIVNQYSNLFKQPSVHSNQVGELFLLGQKYDFRTSQIKPSIYDPLLQKALLGIMQESLQTEQQKTQYALHLHKELAKIVKWSKSQASQNHEIEAIKTKIKSSLWISEDSIEPFNMKSTDLHDNQLCQGFINDAIRFLHFIVEPANYLNRVLHRPMEMNGLPVSGNEIFEIANPFKY